jgi:hypothetical protein
MEIAQLIPLMSIYQKNVKKQNIAEFFFKFLGVPPKLINFILAN